MFWALIILWLGLLVYWLTIAAECLEGRPCSHLHETLNEVVFFGILGLPGAIVALAAAMVVFRKAGRVRK